MGRRSVWSQPEVIEVAKEFVTAADEVWRLQTGEDAECRAFQAMADGAHYRGKGGTRQGIYLVAPSGRLLASINSNNPKAVLEMIERGRAAWEELPDDQRWLADADDIRPERRWEEDFPADGLVLEQFNRDLGESGGRWNRDHAWFSKAEARDFLPESLEAGAEFSVPSALVRRLARFHLVDDVRGQTVPFAPSEVILAELNGRVTAVDGARVHVTWRGESHSDAKGPWLMGENIFKPKSGQETPHGLAARLEGEAVFDLKSERFLSFDLVALADRWGHTRFNGRWRNPEDGQVGFVFRIAPDQDERRIPPAFVDVYDAPWLGKRTGAKSGESQ